MIQAGLRRSRHALAIVLLEWLAVPSAAQATFPGLPGGILYTCSSSADEDARPRLCIVGADGPGGRRVVQGGHGAAWSPDGLHFAYVKEAPSDVSGGNPTERIHLSSIDGPSVTRQLENEVGAGNPTWSPDGTRLAFEGNGRRGSGDTGDIWVTTSRDASAMSRPASPVWTRSRTGRRTAGGSPSRAIARTGGRRSTPSMSTAEPSPGSPARPGPAARRRRPSWAPDGSKLAFVREQTGSEPLPEGSARDLYVVNADGSGERAVTDRFGAGERGVEVRGSVWSPDGTRIAFSYDTLDQSDSLRIIGADGSGETAFGVRGFAPDWGPTAGSGPAQAPPCPG